jgi:hypothetical protein
LSHDNLFALAVLANLRTIQTKKEGSEFDRLEFKKHLYNLVIERNFEPEIYYDLVNFINYLMVLPEPLTIEYDDFTDKSVKKTNDMIKMKPAPSTIKWVDAWSVQIFGIDVTTAKRQIQVEKRRANRAEAKTKETEAKAKETEAKAKELTISLVLNLRFDRTVEELASIAKTSVDEVKAILAAHPI